MESVWLANLNIDWGWLIYSAIHESCNTLWSLWPVGIHSIFWRPLTPSCKLPAISAVQGDCERVYQWGWPGGHRSAIIGGNKGCDFMNPAIYMDGRGDWPSGTRFNIKTVFPRVGIPIMGIHIPLTVSLDGDRSHLFQNSIFFKYQLTFSKIIPIDTI